VAQIDPDTQAAETHSHRRRRDGRAGRRFYPRRPSPARSKSGSRGLDNPVRYPARSGPFTSNATSFCFCRTDNRGGRPGGGILVEREHRVHRPVDENPYRSVDVGGTCRRGIAPYADKYLYLSKDRTKSTVRQIEASLRTVHSGCPMSIPDSARKRIPDFGDSLPAGARDPSDYSRLQCATTIEADSNSWSSRLRRRPEDRRPSHRRHRPHPSRIADGASGHGRDIWFRPALRRNRSPTNHKDPFPLISLLSLLRREQLCLRRVR